mgnify:CR=1 FL=1
MKTFAKIVLFLFCVFLITPTFVSVVKEVDTSYFFTLNEEEKTPNNPIEEHKTIPVYCYNYHFLFNNFEKRNNFSKFETLNYKLLAQALHLPPPEVA